jgi:hypothetical protein
MRRDAHGTLIPGEYSTSQSCLERVHLSYCTNLTQMVRISLPKPTLPLLISYSRASSGFSTAARV